jgi:hypothetical protein
VSAALGVVVLLIAALLPERLNRVALARRGLGVLGVLALLPAAEASGTWPFLALAAAAAALATPLPLVLGAAGALFVALRPGGAAPLALPVAALATAVVAEGLDAARRARRASGGDPSGPILVAGLLLALVLAAVDGGSVLSWTFGVGQGSERVLLGGVGTALGAALLAAIAGILLLGGATVAPPAPGPRRAGLWALGGAAALAASGIALALLRLSGLPEGPREAVARPLALLLGATGALAVLLLDAVSTRPEESLSPARAARAFRVAATLAVVAAAAAGVEGWWRGGTYATGLTATSAAAALLGLASMEPLPRLAILPRLLFAGSLLFLLLA